ncbi:hypothetical protein NM688_g7184 [Phlebia brevispora]|uniref:Uncharacterized protein n=1 Tax=Phlebia brevispora TaxID=194682 RepID=A0ACC1S887_9APHY|nr:hypothetical protein NM688_g7184 [Phlebia brevispora]
MPASLTPSCLSPRPRLLHRIRVGTLRSARSAIFLPLLSRHDELPDGFDRVLRAVPPPFCTCSYLRTSHAATKVPHAQDGSFSQDQDFAIQYHPKSLEADSVDVHSWHLLSCACIAGQKYNKPYEVHKRPVYRGGCGATSRRSIGLSTSKPINIESLRVATTKSSGVIDAYVGAAELDSHNVPMASTDNQDVCCPFKRTYPSGCALSCPDLIIPQPAGGAGPMQGATIPDDNQCLSTLAPMKVDHRLHHACPQGTGSTVPAEAPQTCIPSASASSFPYAYMLHPRGVRLNCRIVPAVSLLQRWIPPPSISMSSGYRSRGSRLAIETDDRTPQVPVVGARLHFEQVTTLGPEHVCSWPRGSRAGHSHMERRTEGRLVAGAARSHTDESVSLVVQHTLDAVDAPMLLDVGSVPLENTESAEISEELYEYWYALRNSGAVFRLDSYLFVLQDWDEKHHMLKIGKYSHVACLPRGPNEFGIACNCISWKTRASCIHQSTLREKLRSLLALDPIAPFPTPPAVYFHSTPFLDAHIFSCVSSMGRHESGKRSVVSLQRTGRWYCESCRYASGCKHIPHAKQFALDAKLISPNEEDDSNLSCSSNIEDEPLAEEVFILMQAGTQDRNHEDRRSISHLPIDPPPWCSLPTDPPVRPTTSESPPISISLLLSDTGHVSPLVFNLDVAARCSCGFLLASSSQLHTANGPAPITVARIVRPAVVYGLSNKHNVSIEVVPCPKCCHHRRLIGPDLGDRQLFNFNNSIIFTHELLNSYTSAYTASETPFSAFCFTVRRTYSAYGSQHDFCADETFVRAWFAFIRIQRLDSGMACPQCGSSPSIVIVDGVSLGTHTSKLLSSVHPPTRTDETSEIVDTISSYKARNLPAIAEAPMRSLAKKLLQDITGIQSSAISAESMQSFVTKYPALATYLKLLSDLRCSSSLLYKPYRAFAQQILAPDIVLQLVPVKAIESLRLMGTLGSEPSS